MIAFLGMGLLGSNFVRALRKRGEEVQVWNRTPDKARRLTADGARVFEDVADAVRGAERVHLTLSDDAAVDDVLERAKGAFGPGVLVIDHTTTSPAGAAARSQRWAERGIGFLHAPVFMGPQNALDSSGIMLVSGDSARIATVRIALEQMTGKLIDLGERVEAAASFKLLGNMFLMFVTSGLADVLALAKSLGFTPSDVGTLLEHFNPGSLVPARLERMRKGNFGDPSWELAMARKDARLMMEAASAGGVPLAVLPAIAARMDEMIKRGHAHDDWTVIGKDSLPT
jgi:3-hydroxyisobutyrate dehydrogenase